MTLHKRFFQLYGPINFSLDGHNLIISADINGSHIKTGSVFHIRIPDTRVEFLSQNHQLRLTLPTTSLTGLFIRHFLHNE